MKRLFPVLLVCMALMVCAVSRSFCAPNPTPEKPVKGDFILGAGWAYSAPKDDTADRLGDWTASLEYMLTDKLSVRSDYYRLNEQTEETTPAAVSVPVKVDPEGASLTLAPHVGNVSFPIGGIGLNTPDRKDLEFGVVGGAWIDFWTSKHVGLGFGGNYLMLKNTTIGQDSYDVRGELRMKF